MLYHLFGHRFILKSCRVNYCGGGATRVAESEPESQRVGGFWVELESDS